MYSVTKDGCQGGEIKLDYNGLNSTLQRESGKDQGSHVHIAYSETVCITKKKSVDHFSCAHPDL